jgi:amino acid transporter
MPPATAASSDSDAAPPKRRGKKISWQQLVGLTFFAVCGGDYGIEDTVGAAGARLTLLGLLILPWIWSLPIALMTAELSSMIPESGGYVVWVHRAFGPFWAHQNAMWNLVSNTFDNALYPVMFVDYLRYFPAFKHLVGMQRWLVSISMLGCVTGLNLLGVDGAPRVTLSLSPALGT